MSSLRSSLILLIPLLMPVSPSCLKIERIIPIYKSGYRDILKSFRPTSAIQFLSKIMERIIYNGMSSFIYKYCILADEQYCFRRGKSPIEADLYFTQGCYANLNNE